MRNPEAAPPIALAYIGLDPMCAVSWTGNLTLSYLELIVSTSWMRFLVMTLSLITE